MKERNPLALGYSENQHVSIENLLVLPPPLIREDLTLSKLH